VPDRPGSFAICALGRPPRARSPSPLTRRSGTHRHAPSARTPPPRRPTTGPWFRPRSTGCASCPPRCRRGDRVVVSAHRQPARPFLGLAADGRVDLRRAAVRASPGPQGLSSQDPGGAALAVFVLSAALAAGTGGRRRQRNASASVGAELRKAPSLYDRSLNASAAKWLRELPVAVRPSSASVRFPRIVNRLARFWESQPMVAEIFEDLLMIKRPGRKGFPPDVLAEFRALQLYWQSARPRNDGDVWSSCPIATASATPEPRRLKTEAGQSPLTPGRAAWPACAARCAGAS